MKNHLTRELYHYGVIGMKWGVRRYQNSDGTLTSEGKKRKALIRKTGNAMKTTKDANEIVDTLTKKKKRSFLVRLFMKNGSNLSLKLRPHLTSQRGLCNTR